MISLRKSATAYSGFVVLSLIWGMAFVAIRRADAELSPVNLALIRWFVASIPFAALLPVIGRPKVRLDRGDVPRLLVIAFCNVVGYHVALNYAETTVSAGLSGLLISFAPIFTVILSYFLLKERVGARLLLGLVLAVAGAAVLSIGYIGISDLSSISGPGGVIIAALCYALFAVLAKPLVHKYGSAPTTILAGLLGTAMLLPLLSKGFFGQVESLSFYGWASVLYLSLLSTVFGYLLFYTLVSRGAVSRLSIQLYLVPVVSVIGGALLLRESFTASVLLGGGLMLCAVALTTWK